MANANPTMPSAIAERPPAVHATRRARGNVAGTDRHADHRHRGDADREGDRDQEEFQPRADAVARKRLRAEARDQAREHQDGEHGLQRRQACQRADLENVEEHLALERGPAQPQRQPAAAGAQEGEEDHEADGESADLTDRHARHAQARERAEAETQRAADRDLQQSDKKDRRRRHQHVAGAADDGRKRVDEPYRDDAREHHVRVSHRLRECGALPAKQPIDGGTRAQEERREGEPGECADHDGMNRQRVGALLIAIAERAADRR